MYIFWKKLASFFKLNLVLVKCWYLLKTKLFEISSQNSENRIPLSVYNALFHLIIPLANKVGGYIGFNVSVFLSVCLSASLSVWLPSGDMILFTHALYRKCMGAYFFFENLYTNYLLSEDVHLKFSYLLDNFSPLYRFFAVFGLCRFFK